LLLLRDPGNRRRALHVFLIFAVLVLTCNAKITWEFLRSANQALAIRALKIAAFEANERAKSRKPPKRALRLAKISEADTGSQAGLGINSAPSTFQACPGCLLVPPTEFLSGNFIRHEPIVAPVALSFFALWRRPPPCTRSL
jgi:hypothetical protein